MINRIRKNLFIGIIAYALTANLTVQAVEILPIDCMIEPNIMVDISSPVDGVLDTLLVDRSDEVKEGEVIATLKSEVEQVTVKMSKERLELSLVKYKRAKGLYKKRAITLTEKDQLNNEKKLAVLDLKHAKANLELKKIRSPIDGVVVKRYSTPGEFVEADPIIKLAQLDPLKIEVVSPVSNYGKIVKGMRAKILPDFGGYPDLIAEVVVVDKVIDAASGTFGIRLELENKDHMIPSGLKCKVHFLPELEKKATIEETAVVVASTNEELMCLTIGPYKEQQTLKNMLAELDPDIEKSALRSDIKTNTTYLVISELIDTLEQSQQKMQSMKAAGFSDIAIMNINGKHRLALGLYRRQSYAHERVAALKNKGYEVQIKPVSKEVSIYWADIAHLPQSVSVLNNAIPEKFRTACEEVTKLSLLK